MLLIMVLSKIVYHKRVFDPSVKKDREIAHTFLKKRSWSGISHGNLCPFHCEWPYLNVPDMLKDRLLDYYSMK